MREHHRTSGAVSWSDVVLRAVIALAAGGFTSWTIYQSVVSWIPLAFLAAFLGTDLWSATARLRSLRRARRARPTSTPSEPRASAVPGSPTR